MVINNDAKSIGPFEFLEALRKRLFWREAISERFIHQMRYNFRIRLRTKIAMFEIFANIEKVFDNAVMNYANTAREMRMSICFIGHAMGRPARMSYPNLTIYVI